jgi:pantoate--beta-alanine ligase
VLLSNFSELTKHIGDKVDSSILGLVPTMGALHEGHLSLIKKALIECDNVVVSIFVNPTQFNNSDDLIKYPRTITSDLEAIHGISKGILVYVPSVEEIYPEGAESEHFDFGTISEFMEGKFRQGHFDGVGTVLKRLFKLINPDKAFFGEKDFQQLAVVRKLIKITGQNVSIIGCETYRENNGLAKSSRNKLLSEEEKEQAGIIFENLYYIKNNFENKPIPLLLEEVKRNFEKSQHFELEYCEVAEEKTLIPTDKIKSKKKYRAFIAAYCNKVRLIDNMSLN